MIESEIVKVEQDESGAIRVWSCYKIDGVEVTSNYPKVDGKSVYCIRYDALQFIDKTEQEIKDIAISDSKSYLDTLVQKEYLKSANAPIAEILKSVVGSKASLSSTEINIGETSKVILNQDGTKSAVLIKG